MMGDNVNLAARMESGAKSWGTYSMVTEETRRACEHHGGDQVVFRALGKIVVKGRTQPVPIHEVVGLRKKLTAATLEGVMLFEQGLERYYARDWGRAAEFFERSAALERLPPGQAAGVKSSPSLVYLGIVAEMADHPPSVDWDGAYVMIDK
jgi:adenylate cyclase